MRSYFLLPLIFLLLFSSCRKKDSPGQKPDTPEENISLDQKNSLSQEREEDPQSPAPISEAIEESPAQKSDQIPPEKDFPMEKSLLSGVLSQPIGPTHGEIGALMPLVPEGDEKDLFEKSETFLEGSGRNALYYQPVNRVLTLKTKSLEELSFDSFLIGRPRVLGQTGEVDFVLTGEKVFRGTFYWIFEDTWYLENFELYK